MIKDFSWSYFASTGDIHAYLLYKEHHQTSGAGEEAPFEFAQEELGETHACL
ncbi:YqzL family protein [Brevibacillus ruminantium]|uniref:YqzL family protein n=1 Tax=Brevibacillus ruminantium TaxID=2950604 RepID=A0ABY4WAQ2_9BACL|nr:YqzL family protein [Brevibacillus ruminantium]USG63854.1 YqzL family protein [Brevibacillus ruminantium]